jgi:DNA-binding transcriptional regulator YdaS (Cro superfamily)
MKKSSKSDDKGIDKAISKAGSQVKLAALIGTTQQVVSYWKKSGIVVDASMCAVIEQKTGVPCEELNPTLNWTTLREVLCAPDRQNIDATDDTQHNAGGSSDKKLEMRAVAG